MFIEWVGIIVYIILGTGRCLLSGGLLFIAGVY